MDRKEHVRAISVEHPIITVDMRMLSTSSSDESCSLERIVR